MDADLESIRGCRSLEQVVRFALGRGLDLRVVPMDEFTNDVVVPVTEGLVLVFDSN
jgi:hypothetical protein